MKCPFVVCRANLTPVIHRSDANDPDITTAVYPIHNVVGDGSWFGRCPASMLIVPHITEAGKAVLIAGLATFRRMRDERDRVPQAPRSAADMPDQSMGREANLPIDDYFPVRPAEAGDDPQQQSDTTWNSTGVSMESARDQLRQLVSLANNSFGQTQDMCARMIASLQILAGLQQQALTLREAAHAIALAAVGSDLQSTPESAQNMVASSLGAEAALDEAGTMIEATIQLVNAAYTALAAAVDSGNQYRAIP